MNTALALILFMVFDLMTLGSGGLERLQKLDALTTTLEERIDLHEDMARGVANLLRDHFMERNINGPRNQFGAPSSGFWGEIRETVNDGEADLGGFSVTIADYRFPQKYYGGPIVADDHLLAIPARSEAYNKSPRLFSNLTFVMFKSGAMAFVSKKPQAPRQRGEKRIGKAHDEGSVFYWLVSATRPQQRDRDALPAAEKILDRAIETGMKHIKRHLA